MKKKEKKINKQKKKEMEKIQQYAHSFLLDYLSILTDNNNNKTNA